MPRCGNRNRSDIILGSQPTIYLTSRIYCDLSPDRWLVYIKEVNGSLLQHVETVTRLFGSFISGPVIIRKTTKLP